MDAIGFVLLAIIASQDYRSRPLSMPALIALFLVFGTRSVRHAGISSVWSDFAIIFTFILCQVLLLSVFFTIRERRQHRRINRNPVLNGILFLLIPAALFSPINFMAYYAGTSLIILLAYGIYVVLNDEANHRVPLVGCMATLLVPFLILSRVTGFSLRDDQLWFQLLHLG